MKSLILSLAVLFLAVGCATPSLSGFIEEQEEVGNEWKEVTLNGRYSGEITANQVTYERYEFCGFKDDPQRILEIWKPMGEGDVLLKEHRDYLLSGDLPLVLETGFGLLTTFKMAVYRRVNYEGEILPESKKTLELPHSQNTDPLEPNIRLNLNRGQLENERGHLAARLLPMAIGNGFVRPEDSGQKWYLMTTRVNSTILGKRTRTNYFLSTPKKEFKVDTSAIDYEERSWAANKLIYGAYLVTVPVDIVSVPIIGLGIGAVGIYKSIFD